jgi:hypothetical protein
MQKFTLKNKINVFNFLYLLLFLFVALVCISFCQYYIYGDSQFYIDDLCKLRGDYFPENFKVLFAGTGEHISLKTEGGFSFFLFLFSYISWELPFFVSAFFTVGFLFIISLLSRDVINKKPLPGFVTILLLLLIPGFAYGIFMLSECLRDASAHFFGLLGFMLCCIGVNRKVGKSELFFGTFCIGIACWCRVPDILFIIPAGLYLLLSFKGLRLNKFVQSMLLMTAGLIVGLLPLFGQNILEGRPFYVAGQMNNLVLKPSPKSINETKKNVKPAEQIQVEKLVSQYSARKDFSGFEKGMSIKNFSSTGKNLYRYIEGTLGKYILWLFLLCSLTAVLINYRLSIALLSGSLVFFLFYSCYDKVVGRYAVIIPLLLLPMTALSLSKFIDLVFHISKQQKHDLIIKKILTGILTLVCMFFMFNYAKGFESLVQEKKYCLAYKEKIEKEFGEDDVYICFNPIIDSWTTYFTGAEKFSWLLSTGEHWDIFVDKDVQFKMFDDKIEAGKNAFYIEMQSDDMPFKYWRKQDLNLHYEIDAVSQIAPMFNEYGKVIVSKITKRNAEKRIIKYSMDSQSPTKLILWTADASDVVSKKQEIVLTSGNISVTNQLISGINLYNMPNDFLNGKTELKMFSPKKLPIVIAAKAFSTNSTLMFQSYENMPAALLTLPGSKPFWHGKYHWDRESRKDGKYIDPFIAVPQSTVFSVFNKEKIKMTLRVSTLGTIESQALKENLEKLTLTSRGKDYPLSIDIVDWSKKGNRRIIIADLSTNLLNLPDNINEFEINIKDADKASIFLDSISFSY